MTREDREAIIRRLECLYNEAEGNSDKEALFYAIEALKSEFYWRSKPLPSATHCLVAIKWAPDDIEVTEADTTFLLKEHSERIVAWMPLPDPPKGGDS